MFLLVSLALAAGVAFAVVAVGWHRGKVTRTALSALGLAAVAWIAGLAVILNEWRDTDGFVDCNQHCHGWHWLGALWFLTPALGMLILAVIAGISAAWSRRAEARAARGL